MSVAIIYGSTTGNTQNVAQMIEEKLGGGASVLEVTSVSAATFDEYDGFILGVSTWGDGDLQDDWDEFDFADVSLSGKKVAIFGLGDSDGYPDTFCDGVGILAQEVEKCGGEVVGEWENEGYEFDDSKALKDNGKFAGLILDMDNQEDETEARVSKWVDQIKGDFN